MYPLIAVARELQAGAAAHGTELKLHFMGPGDKWSESLIAEGVEPHWILAGKLRRYASGMGANLLDIPKLIVGMVQAWFKMFWLMPDAVFSKGGPGAFPVVLAAWFFRVPVLAHDSDAKPGVTTLLSARFARKIAVSFPETEKFFPPEKTILTGNPVRKELSTSRKSPEEAKKDLGFAENAPLLLVLGGSQGSTRINEFILLNLKEILGSAQVLHQAGTENLIEAQKLARAALSGLNLTEELQSRYRPVPFLAQDYASALRGADVVLARAGSSTIFELAALGKPAILVPLPESANDHQRANAYAFQEAGAGVVIEESNLLPAIFLRELKRILENTEVRAKMESSARAFAKPDAAQKLAGTLWELAR